MLHHVRSRLSYANLMSTIAVMIALGGTSYAAIKLPRNSVGTAQVRNNAITAAKVKNRSLLAADFKLGQLPAGAPGAAGAQGLPGTNGAPGPAGPTGETGAPGAAGPKGEPGAPGSAGPKGETGAPGAKGDPGTPGAPGTPGTPGADGEDGEDGMDGAPGTARAYGYVTFGCVSGVCPFNHAKNVTSVTRVATGTYCVTVSDPLDQPDPATDIIMTGVEVQQTSPPEGSASAMAASTSAPCAVTEFRVMTQRLVTATSTTVSNSVSFWFAIP